MYVAMTPSPSLPSVPDVLEKAADLLETVGHCTGASVKYNNWGEVIGYCATGAVTVAITKTVAIAKVETFSTKHGCSQLYQHCMRVLAKRIPAQDPWQEPFLTSTTDQVIYWNDTLATAAEVIDLMKHTAKDLRNGGEAARSTK